MESTDLDEASESDDDMSAGARLMRYNVSDGPRLECRSFDLGLRRRSSNSGPLQRTTYDPLAQHRPRDGPQGWFSDLDRFPKHDIVLPRGLIKLEAEALQHIAGRRSNRKVMLKISTFRPQARLVSKVLTWRVARFFKGRARSRGLPKRQLVLTSHAIRTTSRATPKQVPWSLPQPPAPRPTECWASKTSASASSRLPPPQAEQRPHVDHIRLIHFVRNTTTAL
jgi:hypothetical protein